MQSDWFDNRVRKNDNQVDFEIHDLESKKLIGHCGLYYINWISRHAEFTIYVGDMKYRSGGRGSDALRTLFKYGFEELNLNKIWCEVYDNNKAIDIYKHLGFTHEGTLRNHVYKGGTYYDAHMLSIFKRRVYNTKMFEGRLEKSWSG